MAPRRKSPIEPRKMEKDYVPRKLLNEESDYKDEEPLLKILKKKKKPNKMPPPSLIEVEDTDDTESTTGLSKRGSRKVILSSMSLNMLSLKKGMKNLSPKNTFWVPIH